MIKGSIEYKIKTGEVVDLDLVLDFTVDEYIKEIHRPKMAGMGMLEVMARCEARHKSATLEGKRTIRQGFYTAFCESPDHIVDVEANTLQYIKQPLTQPSRYS